MESHGPKIHTFFYAFKGMVINYWGEGYYVWGDLGRDFNFCAAFWGG